MRDIAFESAQAHWENKLLNDHLDGDREPDYEEQERLMNELGWEFIPSRDSLGKAVPEHWRHEDGDTMDIDDVEAYLRKQFPNEPDIDDFDDNDYDDRYEP